MPAQAIDADEVRAGERQPPEAAVDLEGAGIVHDVTGDVAFRQRDIVPGRRATWTAAVVARTARHMKPAPATASE